MLNRQTFLLSNWGFICQCKLCEEENGQDEAKRYYEKFEILKQQTEAMFNDSKNPWTFSLQKVKNEVSCFKEMYLKSSLIVKS